MNRLQHNIALMLANHLVEMVALCIPPVARRQTEVEYYRASLAMLQTYEIKQDRLRWLEPSVN